MSRHVSLSTVLVAVAACAPLAAQANDCEFHARRSLDIPASGIGTLRLDTGAGDLVIEGVEGLASIEVRGDACASEQAALDGMSLEQSREGAIATAATKIPDEGYQWSLFGSHYAYMDVHVRMPAALKLELRDSSGDIEASKLDGDIELTDSSGDMRLRDLGGSIRVGDSSGDIDIAHVKGSVSIRSDSSGDIDIASVAGDAIVEEDSSGDVDLRDIDGNARVDRDSSGDIQFSDIGRDARVGKDSSGDIRADTVGGDFSVTRKSGGSDNIRHRGVAGKVSLPPGD
jgi:hypothetical protein